MLTRRNFIKTMMGAAVGGGVAAANILPATTVEAAQYHSGADLSDWYVAIGDGLWAADGQAWPTVNDIATHNYGAYSELVSNVHSRGVMAHNITYKRIIDTSAFNFVHLCRYKFRLPEIPTPSNWQYNAQTLEGGFFIWDGGNTQLDYGLAFQWILNPWMSSFGDLYTWDGANGQWLYAGHLPVDTEWHDVQMAFDHTSQTTALIIDGVQIPSLFTGTPKYGWGTETAARLQAEIINVWPGQNQSVPHHKAEFKDWEWQWFTLY